MLNKFRFIVDLIQFFQKDFELNKFYFLLIVVFCQKLILPISLTTIQGFR